MLLGQGVGLLSQSLLHSPPLASLGSGELRISQHLASIPGCNLPTIGAALADNHSYLSVREYPLVLVAELTIWVAKVDDGLLDLLTGHCLASSCMNVLHLLTLDSNGVDIIKDRKPTIIRMTCAKTCYPW
jgi:hypothetical protein